MYKNTKWKNSKNENKRIKEIEEYQKISGPSCAQVTFQLIHGRQFSSLSRHCWKPHSNKTEILSSLQQQSNWIMKEIKKKRTDDIQLPTTISRWSSFSSSTTAITEIRLNKTNKCRWTKRYLSKILQIYSFLNPSNFHKFYSHNIIDMMYRISYWYKRIYVFVI